MRKKILIGSIFSVILILSVPIFTNIQAQQILVNEEPEVTSTEKPIIICLFLRGLYNRILWKLTDTEPDSNERLLVMLAFIVGIPYFSICETLSTTTSNADGCSLCPDV